MDAKYKHHVWVESTLARNDNISITLKQQRMYLYMHRQSSKNNTLGVILWVRFAPHLVHWVESITQVVNRVFSFWVSDDIETHTNEDNEDKYLIIFYTKMN